MENVISPNHLGQQLTQFLPPWFNSSFPLLLLAILGVAITVSLILKVGASLMAGRLAWLGSKSFSFWEEVAAGCLRDVKVWVLTVLVFNSMVSSLELSTLLSKVLFVLVVLSLAYQFAIWGFTLMKYWKSRVLDQRIQSEPSSAAALGLFYKFVQAGFLIGIALVALSNLGVDIAALIAGLGIGGIAVALAAQNVLGDLLASLSIVLDRPFVVGDFIVAGPELGTIEHIGIKTTRLRSLSGEEVVLSNKDLLESRIHNFKRMWKRRVVQKFGVTYSTSAENLEKIPIWVKEIVASKPLAQLDRCHFCQYGDSSLDFEFVFFVDSPEFNVFMDVQQSILLDIFKKFQQHGVDFAFPSRSIYLETLPKLEVQSSLGQ